jgi:hypothetical protein
MSTRALAVLLLATSLACVKNNGSVEPFTVCAMPDDPSACGQAATCSKTLASAPYVYTQDSAGNANELILWLEFHNNVPNNADPTAGRVNTNDAYVKEYRLSFSAAGVAIPGVTVSGRGTVPAAGTATLVATLVPASITQYLSAHFPAGTTVLPVKVTLRAAGEYQDGTSFVTGDFDIPVDVISGGCTAPVCGAGQVRVTCPNECQSSVSKCITL